MTPEEKEKEELEDFEAESMRYFFHAPFGVLDFGPADSDVRHCINEED